MAANILNSPQVVEMSVFVFKVVFDAIRKLTTFQEKPRRKIGFAAKIDK